MSKNLNWLNISFFFFIFYAFLLSSFSFLFFFSVLFVRYFFLFVLLIFRKSKMKINETYSKIDGEFKDLISLSLSLYIYIYIYIYIYYYLRNKTFSFFVFFFFVPVTYDAYNSSKCSYSLILFPCVWIWKVLISFLFFLMVYQLLKQFPWKQSASCRCSSSEKSRERLKIQ